jgi:hypothetical protein
VQITWWKIGRKHFFQKFFLFLKRAKIKAFQATFSGGAVKKEAGDEQRFQMRSSFLGAQARRNAKKHRRQGL